MAHLQRSSSETAEGTAHDTAYRPLRDTLVQNPQLQPLGVLLVCRHNETWHRTGPEQRHLFDFGNPQVLKRWEEKIEGRVYKIYGYNEAEKGSWDFFTLIEFDDLQAWNRLQEKLDETGFSAYFDWKIIAFGRRIGS